MTPPKRYDELTNNAFADEAARTFDVRDTTGGVILVGHCPRCGDPMEFPWVDDSYRGAHSAGVAALPAPRRVITMLCTCTCPHEGRPEDGVGCGAYWNLNIEDSQ
jgi:hypothetical protein